MKHAYLSFLVPVLALVSCGGGGGDSSDSASLVKDVVPEGCHSAVMNFKLKSGLNELEVTNMTFTKATASDENNTFDATINFVSFDTPISNVKVKGTWSTTNERRTTIKITNAVGQDDGKDDGEPLTKLEMRSIELRVDHISLGADGIPAQAETSFLGGTVSVKHGEKFYPFTKISAATKASFTYNR